MSTRKRFRELIARGRLVPMPGAYDALSAKIMEAEGFEAIIAGGYAAIGTMMGQADMGQCNVRDYADHYARICAAVDIPVYVDGDTGFGGVHNVREMVRAFEAAGVAGLFFSDQVFPNRCGYLPGKQIVPLGEMLARVKAALDARRDGDMLIVARTDAAGVEGIEAAIARCRAFMAAGADAAKPQGIDAIADIRRVISEVPGPPFRHHFPGGRAQAPQPHRTRGSRRRHRELSVGRAVRRCPRRSPCGREPQARQLAFGGRR